MHNKNGDKGKHADRALNDTKDQDNKKNEEDIMKCKIKSLVDFKQKNKSQLNINPFSKKDKEEKDKVKDKDKSQDKVQ